MRSANHAHRQASKRALDINRSSWFITRLSASNDAIIAPPPNTITTTTSRCLGICTLLTSLASAGAMATREGTDRRTGSQWPVARSP